MLVLAAMLAFGLTLLAIRRTAPPHPQGAPAAAAAPAAEAAASRPAAANSHTVRAAAVIALS